jgi:hypothetical protein
MLNINKFFQESFFKLLRHELKNGFFYKWTNFISLSLKESTLQMNARVRHVAGVGQLADHVLEGGRACRPIDLDAWLAL